MSGSKEKSGVTSLLPEFALEEFKRNYWPTRLHISQGNGSLDRIPALARVPALQSLDVLLKEFRGPVDAWGKDGSDFVSIKPTTEQIPAFYDAGYTIYLQHLHKTIPEVALIARDIERDLDLRPGEVYCDIFASKKGSGARAHLDANITFNVQLCGNKTWKIAENSAVKFPHVGLVMGDESSFRSQFAYAKGPLPKGMPDDAMTFDTSPGTVVFLPHGYWHTTRAHDDSMAMIFTISTKTWTKTILEELSSVLLMDERWREPGFALSPSFTRAGDQRLYLRELLSNLNTHIDNLDLDALHRRWKFSESDSRIFRRAPGVSFSVTRRLVNGELHMSMIVDTGDGHFEKEIDDSFATFVQWVGQQRGSFNYWQATNGLKNLSQSGIQHAIEGLLAAGLIEEDPAT